jgi:hypothetical protein
LYGSFVLAITIQDLRLSGYDFFIDNESYLPDISDDDRLNEVIGGGSLRPRDPMDDTMKPNIPPPSPYSTMCPSQFCV